MSFIANELLQIQTKEECWSLLMSSLAEMFLGILPSVKEYDIKNHD